MTWRSRTIVHTVDAVEAWLRGSIQLDKPLLIGVDGFDGAGKSHLTRALSNRCGFPYIAVDDDRFRARHFDDGSGVTSYADTTNIAKLREEASSLRRGALPFLVDAVTLGDVLTAVGEKADVRIYVMKLSENFLVADLVWHEQYNIAGFEDGSFPLEPPPLARCILEYHAQSKPHERADLIYAWQPPMNV